MNKITEIITYDNKKYFFILPILVVLCAIISNLPIKLIQKIVDSAINVGENSIKIIIVFGILYLFSQVLRAFLVALLKFLSDKLQQDIGARIQNIVYSNLLKADLITITGERTGKFINSLVEDTNFIINNLVTLIINFMLSIVSFFVGIYFMMTINALLPLFIIPLGLITAIISKNIQKKSEENTENLRFSSQNLWKTFEEGLKGLMQIRIAGFGKRYLERVKKDTDNTKDIILKQSKINSFSYFALSSLFMCTIGIIVIISSIFVLNGQLTIVGLTGIMMYNHMLVDPLVDILELQQKFIKLKVSLNRINEIINIKEDDYYLKERKKVDKIVFEDVCFKYSDNEVLKDVNLCINKGEKVAIIGKTGSGKSTLTKLIAGLYPQTKGNVNYYFKGEEIVGVPKVSYLIQGGYLFDTSIKENIRIFNQNISDEEIDKIIELIELTDLYGRLNDENIGENGSFLSGGEKKRLQFAETISQNEADIYIFDELTGSLDNLVANKIMKNTLDLLKDKICIFIEHNLDYIDKMDVVLEVEDNNVKIIKNN